MVEPAQSRDSGLSGFHGTGLIRYDAALLPETGSDVRPVSFNSLWVWNPVVIGLRMLKRRRSSDAIHDMHLMMSKRSMQHSNPIWTTDWHGLGSEQAAVALPSMRCRVAQPKSPGMTRGLSRLPAPSSKTCIILNRQPSEEVLDSGSLHLDSRHSGGDRECRAHWRSTMSRSAGSYPPIRRPSPVRWIGAVAAGLGVWSFLIWCIWEVSVGLF